MKERTTAVIQGLLKKVGVPLVEVSTEEIAGQLLFQIQTPDSHRLIGVRGETLQAIEYLVKKILEKDGITEARFTVDVGGYKAKKVRDLQQKALMMAERARSFQYDVELTPMSSYERLIIHAALTDAPQVHTESRGEGNERRIVIKYSPQKQKTETF